MIFLVQYDRSAGQVDSMRQFSDTERQAAQAAKLDVELDLHHRGVEREVVLLEAESETALRKNYKRLFEDLATLGRTSAQEIRSES